MVHIRDTYDLRIHMKGIRIKSTYDKKIHLKGIHLGNIYNQSIWVNWFICPEHICPWHTRGGCMHKESCDQKAWVSETPHNSDDRKLYMFFGYILMLFSIGNLLFFSPGYLITFARYSFLALIFLVLSLLNIFVGCFCCSQSLSFSLPPFSLLLSPPAIV